MKSIFLFLFSLTISASFAQFGSDFEKRNSPKKKDQHFSSKKNWGDLIWSEHASQYRPIGWHLSAGLTYMLGNNPNDKEQAYDLLPTGLPGYYLEGGMQHLIKKQNKFLHYVDWGLGIKHFGGQEKYELDPIKDRGNFNFGNIFLRGSAHNVIQLNRYNFIDQAIGMNVDFRIYGGKDNQSEGKYLSPLPSDNQGKFVAQLNYSFGFGFKLDDGLFLVPTFQTPILTITEFNGFNPSHRWFNSRYQPMIFTLKLAWLMPKKGCPKVFDGGNGKKQSEQYQMQ